MSLCRRRVPRHCVRLRRHRSADRPTRRNETMPSLRSPSPVSRSPTTYVALDGHIRRRHRNGMLDSPIPDLLPDGVELTLSELQEMAARQQQQIESQQQMLVAKEQRVKFLKQQEQRHQQIAAENEKLQRLRERVEAQEMKLQKLRALRGQVDQQKVNNSSLTSELESIRSLFNAKEKELSVAVAKVEQLTKQLEELRKGRMNGMGVGTTPTAAAIELEKLRRELLYRNKLNEQQNHKLAQQREILDQRTEEMARIDKRIAELQQRLHRKRLLNQQLANQINAATSAKQGQPRAHPTKNRVRPMTSNIAAVEPYHHTPNEAGPPQPPDRAQDDLHTKLNSSSATAEELPEFHPNKNDPKYQTLPYNTKFTAKYGAKGGDQEGGPEQPPSQQQQVETSPEGSRTKRPEEKTGPPSVPALQNGRPQPAAQPLPPQTVHSIPAYAPPKAHATAVPQGKMALASNSVGPHPPPVPLADGAQKTAPPAAPSVNFTGARHFSTAYSTAVPLGRGQFPETSAATPALGQQGAPTIGKPPMMVAPPYIPPPSMNTTMKVQNVGVSLAATEPKPVSTVQPSSLLQVKGPVQSVSSSQVLAARPSSIYQTSSTRILPVTPHTLGTTPQGGLREVTDGDPASTVSVTTTNVKPLDFGRPPPLPENFDATDAVDADADSRLTATTPRPLLPPKPCVPQKPTPPPRQTHGGIDRGRLVGFQDGPESPSTLGNGQQGVNHRYATKNMAVPVFPRAKVTNGTCDSPSKLAVNVFGVRGDAAEVTKSDLDGPIVEGAPSKPESEVSTPTQQQLKRPTPNELPIKPRPLTIKKQTGVEPPKLKGSLAAVTPGPPTATSKNGGASLTVSNVRAGVDVPNRRIEIPPAFLFPQEEDQQQQPHTVELDTGSGPAQGFMPSPVAESVDVVDHAVERVGAPLSYDGDGSATNAVAFAYANNNSNKLRLDREKRRPLVVDGAALEAQNLLDGNANGDSNVADGVVPPQSDDHGGADEPILQQRQGPVGGTLEENNNNIGDGIGKNREGDDGLVVDSPGGVGEPTPVISTTTDPLSPQLSGGVARRVKKGNLKTKNSVKNARRVSFDPLALLLDAALEGELELVRKTAQEVPNPSAANDEGITALHNAICAGHYEIVKFLVEFGCDVNAQDSDGWTPLHCAASCNNLPMVKFLVEHGACIFATTLSDHETAAEKCEEDEEGFDGCTEYLYSIQEKLGILNNGVVYALYDYDAHNPDELSFKNGDVIVVLRKGDEFEREWWWSKVKDREGYIPRNLLGLYPRVTPTLDP